MEDFSLEEFEILVNFALEVVLAGLDVCIQEFADFSQLIQYASLELPLVRLLLSNSESNVVFNDTELCEYRRVLVQERLYLELDSAHRGHYLLIVGDLFWLIMMIGFVHQRCAKNSLVFLPLPELNHFRLQLPLLPYGFLDKLVFERIGSLVGVRLGTLHILPHFGIPVLFVVVLLRILAGIRLLVGGALIHSEIGSRGNGDFGDGLVNWLVFDMLRVESKIVEGQIASVLFLSRGLFHEFVPLQRIDVSVRHVEFIALRSDSA